MRNVLLSSALTLVSLTAWHALAQDEDAVSEEPSPSEEVQTVETGDVVTMPTSTGGKQSRHVVEKGDTLWDLSEKYLGSPWYWPKVWSYNPEIANPHWIYPGNVVRFQSGGDEAPTQIQVGEPKPGELEEGRPPAEGDRIQLAGQIGYRAKRALTVQVPGIVTEDEVEGFGRVAGSFAESQMLTFPAPLYLKFEKRAAKLGETYVVMRPAGEVIHPVTKARMGHLTRVLGEVKIDRIEKNGVAVASIVSQSDEIERGDLIGPKGENRLHEVVAQRNEQEIAGGVVVAALPMYLTSFAEQMLVVVDRGAKHGVKMGNVFTMWRQHDALGQDVFLNPTVQEEEFPQEVIAQCVAVDVKSTASVCLLVRSIREVVKGDRADVRPALAKTAAVTTKDSLSVQGL